MNIRKMYFVLSELLGDNYIHKKCAFRFYPLDIRPHMQNDDTLIQNEFST